MARARSCGRSTYAPRLQRLGGHPWARKAPFCPAHATGAALRLRRAREPMLCSCRRYASRLAAQRPCCRRPCCRQSHNHAARKSGRCHPGRCSSTCLFRSLTTCIRPRCFENAFRKPVSSINAGHRHRTLLRAFPPVVLAHARHGSASAHPLLPLPPSHPALELLEQGGPVTSESVSQAGPPSLSPGFLFDSHLVPARAVACRS